MFCDTEINKFVVQLVKKTKNKKLTKQMDTFNIANL